MTAAAKLCSTCSPRAPQQYFFPSATELISDFSESLPMQNLAGAMSLLLAFRLQASYKRWSNARLYWGKVRARTKVGGSHQSRRSVLSSAARVSGCQRLALAAHSAHRERRGEI